MSNILVLLATAAVLAFSPHAVAGTIEPDPDFRMSAPDGWEHLIRDFSNLTHPTVAHVLDCVDENPALLKQVGWKMDGKKVLGAYCISYRKSGMRQAAVLLRYSKGKEHDDLAKKFIDTYAGEIAGGYQRRDIRLSGMSADLLEAGQDLIMILDSRIDGSTGQYMRSATIVLHDDALLNVGTVYALDAPQAVKDELDALPLSVVWRR